MASNIVTADSSGMIVSALPAPSLSLDATSRDYLRAARAALAAGHTGEAQQSLEMAETRVLGGSTAPDLAKLQNDDPKVTQIRDALHALGVGDRGHAIQMIDIALNN
jgi:hypothetical protein